MHILLINNNPVVLRMLTFCTRDEDLVLEEVENVLSLERDVYDVVFVDEASYLGQVQKLAEVLRTKKMVLFSNESIHSNDFDLTIKKPFLPSEVMEVLEDLRAKVVVLDEEIAEAKEVKEEMNEVQDVFEHKEENEVLDSTEIEKIKVLLDMEEEDLEIEDLSEEDYEERKIEAIKEQLIAEDLEIVDEEEILESLTNKTNKEPEISTFQSEEELVLEQPSDKIDKSKKKKVKFTEEDLERIEDAIEVAIVTLKNKEMKKLLKGKEVAIKIKLEGKD